MIRQVLYFIFLSTAPFIGLALTGADQSIADDDTRQLQLDPGDRPFVDALRENNVAQLKLQIDAVSDVDLTPQDGRTALMFVAKRNEPALVFRLLERGADPNARNANGGTPLMYAAIAGNVDIVKALVKAGGDIDARGSNGWSALMVAAAKGHAELVSYLISIDVEADAVDVYNWTPLIRATYENRLEVVDVLLESQRVQVNHRDDQGASALHHAAGNGFWKMTGRLIDAGADPTLTDNNRLTPLDRARAARHPKVLKVLCENLKGRLDGGLNEVGQAASAGTESNAENDCRQQADTRRQPNTGAVEATN